MSSLQPLFASAPRIKLYVANQLVGYAIGMNMNVSVDVQPVFALGSYAPVSLEPTMYNTVTGTMQIMRLLTQSTQTVLSKSTDPDASLTSTTSTPAMFAGVSPGQAETAGPPGGTAQVANSPLGQAALFQHLTPAQLLLSQSFDITLYMKVPSTAVTDINGLKEVSWMQISNCRITSRNTNISMGQLVNEPLNFQGLMANNTGDGFALDQSVKSK